MSFILDSPDWSTRVNETIQQIGNYTTIESNYSITTPNNGNSIVISLPGNTKQAQISLVDSNNNPIPVIPIPPDPRTGTFYNLFYAPDLSISHTYTLSILDPPLANPPVVWSSTTFLDVKTMLSGHALIPPFPTDSFGTTTIPSLTVVEVLPTRSDGLSYYLFEVDVPSISISSSTGYIQYSIPNTVIFSTQVLAEQQPTQPLYLNGLRAASFTVNNQTQEQIYVEGTYGLGL